MQLAKRLAMLLIAIRTVSLAVRRHCNLYASIDATPRKDFEVAAILPSVQRIEFATNYILSA